MKSFLERPPYNRPALSFTLAMERPAAAIARVARLRARRRALLIKIRAIEIRQAALLLGRHH